MSHLYICVNLCKPCKVVYTSLTRTFPWKNMAFVPYLSISLQLYTVFDFFSYRFLAVGILLTKKNEYCVNCVNQ